MPGIGVRELIEVFCRPKKMRIKDSGMVPCPLDICATGTSLQFNIVFFS